MAYKEMSVVPAKGERESIAWEYEDVLSSAINGDWVLIPDDVQNIVVTLSFTAGSGKIQSTTDKVETVKNGSPVAVDWDAGVVNTATQDIAKPVTAIRQVNVSGTSKMTVRAQ